MLDVGSQLYMPKAVELAHAVFQKNCRTIMDYFGPAGHPECLNVTAVVRRLRELKPTDTAPAKHDAFFEVGLKWPTEKDLEIENVLINPFNCALKNPVDRHWVLMEEVVKGFLVINAESILNNELLWVACDSCEGVLKKILTNGKKKSSEENNVLSDLLCVCRGVKMLNRPRSIDILEFEDLQADLESLVTLKTGASEIMGIFATCVMADESIKGIVDALKTAFSSFLWNKKAITDVVDVVGEINAAADWSHDSVKAHLEALEGIVENIKKVCVNFDPTLRVTFDTTVVKVMVECVTGLVKAENVHADTTSLASSLLEHFISAFPNNNMLLAASKMLEGKKVTSNMEKNALAFEKSLDEASSTNALTNDVLARMSAASQPMNGATLTQNVSEKVHKVLRLVLAASAAKAMPPNWREMFAVGMVLKDLATDTCWASALMTVAARGDALDLWSHVCSGSTKEVSNGHGGTERVQDDTCAKEVALKCLGDFTAKKETLSHRVENELDEQFNELKAACTDDLVELFKTESFLITAYFSDASTELARLWEPLEPIYRGAPENGDWMDALSKGANTPWKAAMAAGTATLLTTEVTASMKKPLSAFDDLFWSINGDLQKYKTPKAVDLSPYGDKRKIAWLTYLGLFHFTFSTFVHSSLFYSSLTKVG